MNNSCSEKRSPSTSRGGSGFKLVVSNLTELTLNLGPSSSAGSTVGLIVDEGPVFNIVLFPGHNTIVFGDMGNSTKTRTLIQFDAQEHWRNRLHLVDIELNQASDRQARGAIDDVISPLNKLGREVASL